MPENEPPVLDGRRLRNLALVMDRSAVDRFAAAFRDLLPCRVDRIGHTLDIWDRDAAMDAVLSLKTSSSMVGALRMEQLCHRLEVAVSLADYTAAVEAGEEIRMHRPQLQDALDAFPAQALAST